MKALEKEQFFSWVKQNVLSYLLSEQCVEISYLKENEQDLKNKQYEIMLYIKQT